jgi:hypothetical protein
LQSFGRRRPTLIAVHDTTPQRRSLDWARNYLSRILRKQMIKVPELRARRPTVVDVPFTKGKRVSATFFLLFPMINSTYYHTAKRIRGKNTAREGEESKKGEGFWRQFTASPE